MVVPIYQMSNIILFLHPTILFSFLQFFFLLLILTTYITSIQVYIMIFYHSFTLENNIYFTELYLYIYNNFNSSKLKTHFLLTFIICHIYYIFTSL